MVDEVVNQGHFDVVDELFHEDYVDHVAPPGTPPGARGVKAIFQMFRTGFPDVKFTIDQMIGEGNYVATLVHGEGTHTGQFIAVPAERQARGLALGRLLPDRGRQDPRALGHPRPARAADPDRDHPAAAGRRAPPARWRLRSDGRQANAALIQRFYDEGWNANNLDVYDELVTEDFLDHQAIPGLEPGREGFKMLNAMFRSAMPDVWVTVDQIVAEDDKVACRWTSTGTHEGDLFGIPPTGAKVAVTATVWYRIEDGRLAEGWINRDDVGLMRQLGVIPS